MQELYFNKEWLSQKYVIEKLNVYEISKIIGFSTTTIYRQLKKFKIKSRKRDECQLKNIDINLYKNKNFLYEKYVLENLSIDEISKIIGITKTTIFNWLNLFGIKIKDKIILDKDLLKKYYVDEELGIEEVALKLNTTNYIVRRSLKENGISIRNIRGIHKGSKNVNWKGGITKLQEQIRKKSKYTTWRKNIFIKDLYTCKICGKIGGKLQADHIKPFALIMQENSVITLEQAEQCEELWNVDNGRTLCIKCHKKTDTWGYKTVKMLKKMETK